ncbi:LppP/LprE family lipoprotein [Mycobacterium sp. DL440]|uniref:LppP/LprE family lipoprotein n=1 Tax=Mycobacterium sp. DL440 TaxID=2675523 RepID=UPI00352FF33C
MKRVAVFATAAKTITVAVSASVFTLAGCGSGDSTVSKTPEASANAAPAPASKPATKAAPTSAAPAADPCAVNLAAPEIAKAVSELPRDPRSNQAWSSEPLAGNYNECAQLSAVIVRANTNSEHPNTRAVLFHLGKFIPTGVPDTYGFNAIDKTASTGDTVALQYSGGLHGLASTVKFRWNGGGVELMGNT